MHVRVCHRDGHAVITDMFIHAPEITPEILRGVSVSRIQAMLAPLAAHWTRLDFHDGPEPSLVELRQRTPEPGPDTPERSPLTRPDGATPKEFYPRVAAAYSEYAPQTRAPAKEIATEAGVPVTTAHRWIREARRRGFLPPARKGKAG